MKITFQIDKTTIGRNVAVAAPLVVAMALLGVTLRRHELMEPFFIRGTYFVVLTMVLFWASTYILALRRTGKDLTREKLILSPSLAGMQAPKVALSDWKIPSSSCAKGRIVRRLRTSSALFRNTQ